MFSNSINIDDEETPNWLSRTKQRYLLDENTLAPKRKRGYGSETTKFRFGPIKEQDLIIKREAPALKRIMRKYRIKKLVTNFCLKMKRNVIGNKALILQENEPRLSESRLYKWITQTEGWGLSNFISSLFSVMSIISIVALMIIYSLAIVFDEISSDPLMQNVLWTVQMAALPVFILEICLNFATKRYQEGQALVYLNEIATKYLHGKFVMDFINLAVLVADLLSSANGIQLQVLRFVTFLKFPEVLMKMQVIQNLYITTFYREQYWGLFIVLAINFTFAHILSVLLNGMAGLNIGSNWLTRKGLEQSPWSERYVWGYYWGTTIMLTVGFGDLVATNWQQALCLIFIEMISCISLAYNINCVGNLISNLRQQSKEKTQNMKTFQLMAKSNKIDQELQNKINNYIEESFLMTNQFNFKEQDTMLEHLPLALKRQYLKDVNRRIFKQIPFLKNLTLHSQYLLAEHIVRKISHPDQIILNKGDASKCVILRQGRLGMVIKTNGPYSKKHPSKVIQTLQVFKDQASKLLNLGFICHHPLGYTLKSLTYSILYFFENQDLEGYIRQNSLDFQHFCQVRDKFQTNINPDQIYNCQNCPGEYHTRFLCPKLHYLPVRQLVVSKYIQQMKTSKQQRIGLIRKPKQQPIKSLMDRLNMEEDLGNFRSQLSGDGSVSDFPSLDNIYSKDSNRSLRQAEGDTSIEQQQKKQDFLCVQKSEKDLQFGFKTLGQKIIFNVINTLDGMANSFWGLQIDLMHNWKYYFQSDNPKQLKFKKFRPRRLT